MPETAQGLAVVCGLDGALRELLHDDYRLAPCLEAGGPLLTLFDAGSQRKGVELLAELQRHGVARDVELVVRCRERTLVLWFGAVRFDDELFLAAARTPEELRRLCARWSEDDERYVRLLGELHASAGPDKGTETVWEDFTRMYHEFARLQRRVVRQNAELQRLGEEKDRIMRTVAHDLRGPLGAIRFTADYLGQSLANRLSPNETEAIDRIKDVTGRMARLLDDLLRSSREEAAALRPELRREPTELSGLVAGTVRLCEPMAESKGIALRLRADTTVPSVTVDPDRLQQVVLNLIDNAIKFSLPGTEVVVAVARRGHEALVSVRDQGPGIAPEERERIFEPYARGRAQPTHGEPSTGLGLAICRSLVEAHGGRLGVESATGEGAVFSFTLPLDEAPPRGR